MRVHFSFIFIHPRVYQIKTLVRRRHSIQIAHKYLIAWHKLAKGAHHHSGPVSQPKVQQFPLVSEPPKKGEKQDQSVVKGCVLTGADTLQLTRYRLLTSQKMETARSSRSIAMSKHRDAASRQLTWQVPDSQQQPVGSCPAPCSMRYHSALLWRITTPHTCLVYLHCTPYTILHTTHPSPCQLHIPTTHEQVSVDS